MHKQIIVGVTWGGIDAYLGSGTPDDLATMLTPLGDIPPGVWLRVVHDADDPALLATLADLPVVCNGLDGWYLVRGWNGDQDGQIVGVAAALTTLRQRAAAWAVRRG